MNKIIHLGALVAILSISSSAMAGLDECKWDRIGPEAICEKFAECIPNFDYEACLNPQEPVDTSSCTFNEGFAKECLKGIEDAQCGTAEQFYIPDLPEACDFVYTFCGES